MISHYRTLIKSIKFALNGIWQAIVYEKHMRIHLLFALLAVVMGYVLKIGSNEWIVVSFIISLVLFAELMNTALEAHIDLVTKEKKKEAKLAKDVAAGAVLITSINAVVVGYIIFIPKILAWFDF